MIKVSKTPFIKQKLQMWMYQYDFEENLQGVLEPVNWFKSVTSSLFNCAI